MLCAVLGMGWNERIGIIPGMSEMAHLLKHVAWLDWALRYDGIMVLAC